MEKGVPIRVVVAVTPEEIRKHWEIRHKIFCEDGEGEGLEPCPAYGTASGRHDSYGSNVIRYYVMVGDRVIAVGILILAALPSAPLFKRVPGAPDVDEGVLHAEISRLGLDEEFRQTITGVKALLMLVGTILGKAVELGYHMLLLSLRDQLLKVFLDCFPFQLSELPFDYPYEEGGSLGDDAFWLAIVGIHKMIACIRILHPGLYRFMFSSDPAAYPDWYDPSQVGDIDQSIGLVKRNKSVVEQQLRDLETGQLQLAKLASPPDG